MATTTTNSAKTYDQIAWTSLGSTSTSVTLSSIPTGYTDLRLVIVGTVTSSGGGWTIQFNGDTATNYSKRELGGNGGSALSTSQQNVTGIQETIAAFVINVPLMLTLDVFQYANTGVHKTALYSQAADANGSGGVTTGVGLWRSTAAINSITFNPPSALSVGSTFALYGIKAA
jgi:hypothetical protein